MYSRRHFSAIWVDLDNTLIFTRNEPEEHFLAAFGFPQSRAGMRRLKRVSVGKLEGMACVRRGADKFLIVLRELAEVRMLTYATRKYAMAMNRVFDLGFAPKLITAREDWLSDATPSWGVIKVKGVDPLGVLVDNEGDERWHHRKIAYLGAMGRLVTVSSFCGTIADDFTSNWPDTIKAVRKLLRETPLETLERQLADIARARAEIDRVLSRFKYRRR